MFTDYILIYTCVQTIASPVLHIYVCMCVCIGLFAPLYTFLGMQTLRETRSNKRTANKRFDWRVNSANITRIIRIAQAPISTKYTSVRYRQKPALPTTHCS